VIDDVDRDLPTHAGTAADNNNLLGIEVHGKTLLLIILDDSCWAISLPGKKSSSRGDDTRRHVYR
jgi:hypothetical protein